MISNDGTVKLIDFNASRRVTEGKRSDTVNLGTVGYAPPEQYGVAQSDPRSDIYALGVLLNVMLTGRHPSDRLAPGLFDIHCHGAGEMNFNEDPLGNAAHFLRHGTTTVLPTLYMNLTAQQMIDGARRIMAASREGAGRQSSSCLSSWRCLGRLREERRSQAQGR